MHVGVSTRDPAAVAADVLVVNVFGGENPASGDLSALDRRLGGVLSRLAELEELPPKLDRATLLPTLGQIAAPRLLVVATGKPKDVTVDRLRNAAGAALRVVMGRAVTSAAVWFHGAGDVGQAAEAIANG